MKETLTLQERINAVRIQALKEPQKALEFASVYLAEARQNESELLEAGALFAMALACRSMAKLDSCYHYAEESLKIYERLKHDQGMATALNLIGVVYFYYGKLEMAMHYFLKANHYVSKIEDPITESRILNNLGEIYRETGNWSMASESYHKALDLCLALDMKPNIAVILENIGEIYYKQLDYINSYDYFIKSFDMLTQLEDTVALSEVESKIGKMLFLQGNSLEAKKRCYQALQRLNAIDNKFYAIDVHMILAEIMQAEEDLNYLNHLLLATQYAEELSARKALKTLYMTLSKHYESKASYKHALNYFKKFHQIELEIESTLVSQRLEIIKIELNKSLEGDTIENIRSLNYQLEREILDQTQQLDRLEKENQQLDAAVSHDDLTQLLSRRGLKEKLSQLAHMQKGPLLNMALLMIDIDHFKLFNDRFGHVEGDKCLQQMSSAMKSALSHDHCLLARYGGEEFVCILPHADFEQAKLQAELLRRSVAQLSLHVKALDDTGATTSCHVSINISIGGVYRSQVDLKDLQALYIAADAALYEAKHAGRNRVIFAK